MRKTICIIIAVLMIAGLFASCGSTHAHKEEGKLSVVCTVFPQYDWVREILGENPGEIALTLLLDSGTDLHSYQLTAGDLMTIGEADLFIYVGGESDKWVPDALSAAEGDVKCLNMLEALGGAAKPESDAGILSAEEEEEEEAYDEHVWLSLRNAQLLCAAITEELCVLDAANENAYRENCAVYCEKLGALDQRFADFMASAGKNTVVVADRFPFMYLCDDYGIRYFAAFSGCSAESEASFQTVVSLAEKVDEGKLSFIFQTENPLADIAKTVIETTAAKDQKVLTLDSMQAVTAKKAETEKYYNVMEKNINALMEGLKG